MKNNRYVIFTLLFLFLSLAGGIYLIKQNQNNRHPITDNRISPENIPTLIPTNKITSTPPLTITSTPTDEGPSPTRIILPLAGFDFPSQALTLLGGIIILLGFLVLL